MFCKKRSVNKLIGRLPLRDVDFNETSHEPDVKPTPNESSDQKKSSQVLYAVRSKTERNSSTIRIDLPARKNRDQTPKPLPTPNTSTREPLHDQTSKPLPTTTSNSTRTRELLHDQMPKPLPTPTTSSSTREPLHSVANTTPSCVFPSLHDRGTMKAEQSKQDIRTTPSSTFPVSNPLSCGRTHNNLHVHSSKPPTPVQGTIKPEPQSTSIHRNVSVPQHLSSTATQEECRHVTPATGRPPMKPPILSERKTSTTGSLDSGVFVMCGRTFTKVCVLGTGGSSKVFKVIGEDFQMYALKEVYIKHVDPVIKEVFINEIKLLKRLSIRPEIITLHNYDYNKQEGVLYLLLEYAEMDLNAVIKKWNRSNHMINVLYFWSQMLLAVKVIHEEGVVHNDLKPANFVLIGAELRLIDFGISKRIETEQTSFERDMRCGTSNYMSPETIQINEGKDCYKVGRASDVWSLGCILYLMIYGRTPFEHIKGQLNKWNAIVSPNEAVYFPHIENKAAIDIMKKCLRRHPKERPTVNELIAHPFSQNTPLP